MGVNGTVVLVPLQLVVGISPSSNGRERIDVPGTAVLVPMQLVVGISPSSNGRERMDVPGAVVLSAAAKGGHLSVLQWARENGCDWGREAYHEAMFGRSVNQDVFNYVRNHWLRQEEDSDEWDY